MQRTSLLLHACCAPCSIEPIKHLREEGFEPTICWTNPNIQPVSEHMLRLNTMKNYAQHLGLTVIIAEDDRDKWERRVAPHGFDRVARCRSCYAQRLQELCLQARYYGFDHVSTTLVVSPYQLFDECHDVLQKLTRAYGLTMVWRDFRPYYPEATQLSREAHMYRQNYCGCRFSAAEAAYDRQVLRDERKAAKAARLTPAASIAPAAQAAPAARTAQLVAAHVIPAEGPASAALAEPASSAQAV